VKTRVGFGYDIHPLRSGRRLVLGGVSVEHETGLDGHSDADVVAHAVIDALLGAAALGDIGTLFPDDDPRFKDADSMQLLREVIEILTRGGWKVNNVDVTVIAERPRLAPIIQDIRDSLARAVGVDREQVSVKAKTNEGLDAVGAMKAIAAHAVACIDIRA
jgi:2-C-methyl-D-erythritol 2,4-cyclodiphosphate synthase